MPRKGTAKKSAKPVKLSKVDEARAEIQDTIDNNLVVGTGYMQSVLSKDAIQESDVYDVVGRHLDPTNDRVVHICVYDEALPSAAREVCIIGKDKPQLAIVYNQTQVSADTVKALIEDLNESGLSVALLGVLSNPSRLPIK